MSRPRAAAPVLAVLAVAATLTAPVAAAAPSPAATKPAASKPLAGKVVVIDPGHNRYNRRVPASCNTTGTQTRGGTPEHVTNWDVAVRTRARLSALGARVVMTRPDNRGAGPCNWVRGQIANDVKADAYVSIHSDGAPARQRGLFVIWNGGQAVPAAMRPENLRLARALRTGLAAKTGMPVTPRIGDGTGIWQRNDLAALNVSDRPSALIEVGNMRNAADARLLTSPSFREKEAAGIVAGLRAYLRR